MHYILLSQRKKEDAVKHREPNDPPDSCGGESQIQSKYPQPSDPRSADKPQETSTANTKSNDERAHVQFAGAKGVRNLVHHCPVF